MFKRLMLLVAIAGSAVPAQAQLGPSGERLVSAIRGRDTARLAELLNSLPGTAINARSYEGDTPLVAAITAREGEIVDFLLQRGADPALPGKRGETPLIAAARIGSDQALSALLSRRPPVDGANKSGETALIVAVQGRHVQSVRRLLAAGADPDKADSVAGYSARDYAARDSRGRAILALIEAAKPKAAK